MLIPKARIPFIVLEKSEDFLGASVIIFV